MPTIIDYDNVLARMAEQKMRCQYYNSGAFGFDADAGMQFTGWIGPEDSTIRPAALAQTKRVPAPFGENLARLATEVWLNLLPGNVWVMPKSSWAYELDFGSKAWLPAALRLAEIDPAQLEGRTNAPAIEFTAGESLRFTTLLQTLLENLQGSDFALGFPGYPVGCTVHHHKQIWWISTDANLISRIAKFPEK